MKRKPPVPIDNTEMRLSGKHFVSKLDTVVGSKRKAPACKCKVCNFTCEQLAHYSHNDLQLPNKCNRELLLGIIAHPIWLKGAK